MQRFDGVIFDLDGTLLLSEGANVEAMITTMRLHGMPLTETEIKTIPGRSSIDAIPEFLRRRDVPEEKHLALVEENRARYDSLWDGTVQLVPHVDLVLMAFRRRNIGLAIGTTNRRTVVEKFIKKFDLGNLFSVIITGEDVARRKPDPEVYLLAQERIGIPKNKLLVVEDTEIGVSAAKKAGLLCAAIPSEFFKHQDFTDADFLLPSFDKLLSIVF